MAQGSGIEWTESTWNPVTGCSKISPGCKHCYAERMAERLQAMGQRNYRNGFALTLQPHMLELPLRWKKPQTIFVNSMSDLFHDDVPLSYIRQVFDVIAFSQPLLLLGFCVRKIEGVPALRSDFEWAHVWFAAVRLISRHFCKALVVDFQELGVGQVEFLARRVMGYIPLKIVRDQRQPAGHRARRVNNSYPVCIGFAVEWTGIVVDAVGEKLEARSAKLCEGLSRAATEAGFQTVTNRVGSMWTSFFADGPVTNWNSANKSDRQLYGRFFHAMLDEGIYLAPSQFEAAFVSTAHTDLIIDETIEAARKAFQALSKKAGG